MKTIKIILFTLILLAFTSCSKHFVEICKSETMIIKEVKACNYDLGKYMVTIEINEYDIIYLYTDNLYQVGDTIKLVTTNKNNYNENN